MSLAATTEPIALVTLPEVRIPEAAHTRGGTHSIVSQGSDDTAVNLDDADAEGQWESSRRLSLESDGGDDWYRSGHITPKWKTGLFVASLLAAGGGLGAFYGYVFTKPDQKRGTSDTPVTVSITSTPDIMSVPTPTVTGVTTSTTSDLDPVSASRVPLPFGTPAPSTLQSIDWANPINILSTVGTQSTADPTITVTPTMPVQGGEA